MSRGRSFALNKPPQQVGKHQWLPSDRSMQFVAVDLLCRCHPEEPGSTLARFAIDTWHEEFRSSEVYERGDNKAVVERQPVTDEDGSAGVRYVFECRRPGCRNRPVYRSRTLDKVLAHFYEPGARDVVVPIAI